MLFKILSAEHLLKETDNAHFSFLTFLLCLHLFNNLQFCNLAPCVFIIYTQFIIIKLLYIVIFRRSLMSVLPFRRPCLWWLVLMPTYRGRSWTSWRPWWLHILEKWAYIYNSNIYLKKKRINSDLQILFFCSLRYKFARWPWSLPAQCLLPIMCHPDTCCYWQLETRKKLLLIINRLYPRQR